MVFALVAVLTGFAQKTYTWDKYKMQITPLPDATVEEKEDDMLLMYSDTYSIVAIPAKINLSKFSEDDWRTLFTQNAKDYNMDLSKSASDKYECDNGEGLFIFAPNTAHEGMMGIISYAGSNTSQKYCMGIFGMFDPNDAERLGYLLASIKFLK